MLNPLASQYFSQDWLYNNSLKHNLTATGKGHRIELETPQRRMYTVDITVNMVGSYDVEIKRILDEELKTAWFSGITKDMIEAVMSVTILQDNTKSH